MAFVVELVASLGILEQLEPFGILVVVDSSQESLEFALKLVAFDLDIMEYMLFLAFDYYMFAFFFVFFLVLYN